MISLNVQSAEDMLQVKQHQQHFQLKSQCSPSPSRILDIPCKVCGDNSSGKHYNIFACDGCAGFFKRSIRRNRQYTCKAKKEGSCVIDKAHRNQCRACRLQRCQEAGMNRDAVQHERGPRNTTLRRQQISHILNEARERIILPPPGAVLNLTMPKSSLSPGMDYPCHLTPPVFFYNPVLTIPRLPTPVSPPQVYPPPVFSISVICESAAQLLFTNVQWARSVVPFTLLPLPDQLLLLEESWRELFILGSAQFLPITELSSLVQNCEILNKEGNRTGFLQNVQEFQDCLVNIRQFYLDQQEYACLRTIVLFKTNFEKPTSSCSPPPTDSRVLTDAAKIASIQDNTQLTLNKYINAIHPEQPLRFGQLLVLLKSLRNVSSEIIEELFFRKTIGHIPIVRIICDMYKAQSVTNS